MAESGPRVRARHCQDWFGHIDHEGEPWITRFRERVPAPMREEIDSSSRVGWLPMDFHVELANATHDVFGVMRAHAFYRRAASEWLNGPLLGPVVRTGLRMLDVTPGTIVRWVSRGWDVSFKDCGTLVGESRSPTHGRLTYTGLPAVCTTSNPWMESAQGSAYGVLDVIGYDGVVRLDTSGRREGRMFVDMEWGERRK